MRRTSQARWKEATLAQIRYHLVVSFFFSLVIFGPQRIALGFLFDLFLVSSSSIFFFFRRNLYVYMSIYIYILIHRVKSRFVVSCFFSFSVSPLLFTFLFLGVPLIISIYRRRHFFFSFLFTPSGVV